MTTKLSFLTKLFVFLVFNFNQIFADNVVRNENIQAKNVSSYLIKKYKHYCETSPYNCLKLNMLLEIRKMGHQKYYPITDELWLEETNRDNSSANINSINTKTYVNDTKSYLKHLAINKDNIKLNKIISELGDVFKTHSLFFAVVPGKDVEIYRKPRDGKFVMKLQGDSTSYPYFTLVDSPNPHRGIYHVFCFLLIQYLLTLN
uniref:Uncharacterized protein n=1 Tax=Cacopsylla melanoneura TaxID=428564 RepID=A0A8D8Z5V0_9HEMI